MNDRALPGIQPSPDRSPMRPLMWILGGAALIAVIVGFASCQSAGGDDGAGVSGVDSKYVQTWEASYSETTCAEWLGEMTPAQQFAGAADMLTGARNKGDDGTGLPSDALIEEFAEGISTACVIPSMSLAEMGATLYLTEPRFHP